MLIRISIIAILSLSLQSCIQEPDVPSRIEGLKPIYAPRDIESIESEGPRALGSLGKIVLKGDLLFVNELFKGIHAVDNSDPTLPRNIAFWKIPGNIDFTIADDRLYADNSRDIFVIDISDIYDIQVLSVTENAYGQVSSEQYYPREYFGYFECVDISKGIVIDWEMAILESPKCSI